MKALGEAGVDVRYQEFDRCFHAFDAIAGGTQSADKLRRLPTTVLQSSMIAMSMSERINWCGGIERRQTWVTSKRTD
ncbi:MAG: hypothetical protein CM15mP120_29990 [Pseudomonadota bacterium]|nr:MAG: hypothetical protein CM15mP120_29990 [Pseudomonadota bacterium]